MREWAALFKREILDWLHRPALYVLLLAFWVLSGLLAFNILLESRVVTLEPYFQAAPILLALFILAVTSGQMLFRPDDLDPVRLLPVRAGVVVGVRFAGVLLILLTALAGGLGVPLAVQTAGWGTFDAGQLASANLGLFWLGAAFASVGLAASSYARSQTAAFLTSFVILFAFWVPQLAPVTAPQLRDALAQLSFSTHMVSFSRGILWLPDWMYFLTFIVIGLYAAASGFESWRTRRLFPGAWRWKAATAVVLALLHLIAWRIPLRLDLTSSGLHTLSAETENVLSRLSGDVRIVFFRSSRLPAQLQPAARDVEAILEEYRARSPRVKTAVVHPDADPEAARLAQTYGIGEMEVGRRTAASTQLQRVTFGLALVHAQSAQAIPDATDPRFLEYELTSRIKRILTGRRKVAFTARHGEFPEKPEDPRGGFDRLFATIQEFEFVQAKDGVPPDADVLVVAGPIRAFSDKAWAKVEAFLQKKRPVLVLADGMMLRNNMVIPKMPRQWVPNPALAAHLRRWGVELGEDMVLSFEAPKVSVNPSKVITFPLMPMVDASRSLTIMPFTVSTVRHTGGPFAAVSVLRTDPGAWRHVRAYEEDMNWPQTSDRGAFPVGVFLKAAAGGPYPQGVRAVVLGDSDLFRDSNFQTVNTHAIFFRQIMDFLLEDDELAHLRMRGRGLQRLKTDAASPVRGVMLLAVGSPSALLLLSGAAVFILRKRRQGKKQDEHNS